MIIILLLNLHQHIQGQSGQPPPPLSNASIDIVMSRIKIAQGAHDEKSLISTLDLLDQRLAAGVGGLAR